jgi:hypothetical protein
MMVEINFTRSWEDRSPARGFQFAFRCESCNSYYGSALIDLDNRQAGAREHALALAAQQVQRDEFGSCVVCRRWVCAAQCWSLSEHTCLAHRGQAGAQPQGVPPRPRHAQLDQSTEAWNPDMRDELRSMLGQQGPAQPRPSVPGHPGPGQPLSGPPSSRAGTGHFRPEQPPAGSPPPYRPQQADQATQAWAPSMRDELKSMLNDDKREAASAGSDQSTEAWNPNMQDELRSMLGQSAPSPSPGQTPPAQAPKFCSQCGNALTGRFCGRCGTPAY